jgi:hypothetical protein
LETQRKKIMKLLPYFSTIPCEGKRPLVNWQEFTKRHPTEDEYSDWERLYPQGSNFGRGIICGSISRLFVLDVDEGGDLSLQGHNVPKTAVVKTPHGRHYYFRWVPELDLKVTTKVGVLPHVDVRGEGGFVRFYGWETGPHIRPLLAPPQWLIDLLPNRNAPKVIEDSFKKLDYEKSLQTLKDSPRHNTLYQIAGGLRSRGYTPNEIYELLSPKGREVGLPDKDVRYIADRMERYPMGQRPPIDEVIVPESFTEFLQNRVPAEYFVPGIFAKRSIALVVGLPESCKTWTLIDLAIELSRKVEGKWLGQYPTKPARVLYIDQERDKGETQRRFIALIKAKGITPAELDSSLTVRCDSDYKFKINVPESLQVFKEYLVQVRPDIVLIDSFKAFQSWDTSNNQQMQEVFEVLKSLKEEFGCSFVFIYHENKSAHQRVDANGQKKQVTFEYVAGAAVFTEVPETILITVKNDANSSFLHHVKNTYGEKIAPVIAAVENVLPDKSQIRVVAR